MFNKKITAAGAFITTVCAGIVACGGDDALIVDSGTVLQNATVVNTRDGSLSPAMNIVIDAGNIQRITSRAIRTSGAAQAIDATGKYIVPGYLDMHVHSMDVADTQANNWPLLVANGVTGVRQMSGSPDVIAQVRKLNTDSAAGRIDAPEILMAPAAIFGGQASTDAAARQFVQAQKAAGADFLKVVAGNRESLLAILDESRKANLTVAGHLPFTVPAKELSANGWRAIEHQGGAFGQMLDCSSDETTIRQEVAATPPVPLGLGGPMNARLYDANVYEGFYKKIQDTYSEDKCKALGTAFAQNGTWQIPTLIRVRTMAFGADNAYRADPNLVYVGKTTRALWEQLARNFETNVRPSAAATLQQFYGLQLQVNATLKRQGVKILTGTDVGGVWLVPGFSLHQEFRELASAGMSPLDVLQATTLNGAEFLGRQAVMGTVDEGKKADLVLLDANPIDSVSNLGKIAGVVLHGKYLPKQTLEKMKEDVAQANAAGTLKPFSAVIDANHTH